MIRVSYLQNIFNFEGERRLHRGQITDQGAYDDFAAFVLSFLDKAMMPGEPTAKGDAYGWCPTTFTPAGDERPGVLATRRGVYADEHVTLFIADLDNQFEDRPMIEIDTVEAVLSALSLPFVLYTSFSHKPERHKVRIIVPIDRPMTVAEAFTVFTVFNHAFGYQLDGSVYDPGDFLYGPPCTTDFRFRLDGSPLVVADYLAQAEALPEEAKTFVTRASRAQVRLPTAEEIEITRRQSAILTTTSGAVSIHNPEYFNPTWLDELAVRYQGGSRHQTVLGLLTKAWIKSGRTLTRGDLQTLQSEMDFELGGYLRRTYGRTALDADLSAVMKFVASNETRLVDPEVGKRQALENRLARFQRNTQRNVT